MCMRPWSPDTSPSIRWPEALTAVLRLDHEGRELAGSVGVQSHLRDIDDAAVVVGHEEPRPMKAARIVGPHGPTP